MQISFDDLLRRAEEHGIRLTTPRTELLQVIAGLPNRFTASQFVEAAQQEAPTVGRATVFRTLQLLCEANVLEQVRLADGQSVYVKGHPPSHHHHLICSACGRMQNIHSGEVGKLAQSLAAQEGSSAMDHMFEVHGLCSLCQDKRCSGSQG